jgi:hypothetical protein
MGGQPSQPYAVAKRDQKRQVTKPRGDGRAVVFVCKEVLKEIWIHADEVNLTGIITFVTMSNKEIRRHLLFTWFPQGIWKLKFERGDAPGGFTATPTSAQNVDPVVLNRLIRMTDQKQYLLYTFIVEGDLEYDAWTDALQRSAIGRELTLYVTYADFAGTGEKGQQIRHIALSDEYFAALSVEKIARIYLIMLEHFAGISIDERIALGGITNKEYDAIIKIPSKNKDLDAKTIARVVARAAYEYGMVGGDSWECLLMMTETLLYQRKCKNTWALANQLEIGKGLLRFPNGKFVEDLGIKMRGKSALLLYDRFGNAVPAYIGYMDINYRNVDLEKVPHIEVTIGDPGLAQLMKVLEQTFAFPARETYVFCSSMFEFYEFIVAEIGRLYDHDIQKKVMKMLPWAIGFFVAHAVLGAMAARGNVYAAALLVLAKAVGWIMNVDMTLATMKNMTTAGRHFVKMEIIHRRTPKEKGKKELSELSRYHLEAGTRALIEAISDACALGIFVAAGKLGQTAAGRVGKYVRAKRGEAALELYLRGEAIEKIRSTKGEKVIEVQTQQREVKGALEEGEGAAPTGFKPEVIQGGKAGSTKGGKTPSGFKPKVIEGGKGGGKKGGKGGGDGEGSKGGGTKEGKANVEVRTQKAPVERTMSSGKKLRSVPDSPPLEEGGPNLGTREQAVRPKAGAVVDVLKMKYSQTTPEGKPAASESVSGIPDGYMDILKDIVAKGPGGGRKVMALFRVSNARGVQHIPKGNPPKGKDLIELNTNKTTGKVTIKTIKQRVIAWNKGHYVLGKDGFAYDGSGKMLMGEGGKPVKFDMTERGQFGELTNQPGQVIDRVTKKAFIGDFDMQDVIDISSPGRNLAPVPESVGSDVKMPLTSWLKRLFNARLVEAGDVPRVVHGADAQFMQYKSVRDMAFKGDAIGILPDGRVVYFTETSIAKFYTEIGRSRLELPEGTKLGPYQTSGSQTKK